MKGLSRFIPSELGAHLGKLRRLRALRRSHAAQLAILALFAAVTEAFSIGMIVPIVEFIGRQGATDALAGGALGHVERFFAAFGLEVSLLLLCATVMALITLRQVFGYLFAVRQAQVKHHIGMTLAVRCFDAILASNGSHVGRFGPGPFVNLLDHQCQATAMLVSNYATLLILGMTAAAYMAISIVTAPLTSLLAIGVVLVAIGAMQGFVREGRRLSNEVIAFRDRHTGFLGERYRAWRQIKLARAEARETAEIARRAGRFARLSVAMIRQASTIPLVMGIGLSGILLAGLYIAASRLDLSASTIPLFLLIMVRLLPIAQGFANQRNSIAIHGASLDRVSEVLAAARDAREAEGGATEFARPTRAIVFDHVGFRYEDGERDALTDICVEIPAGRVTAVIGPSGAGKSTLVDLLPRLVTPTSGRILLDDLPLASVTLTSLRRNIAFASQDPILFTGSVAANVAYALPEASRSQIEAACRAAGAHDFIAALPDGYDTVIGEEGRQLSGGQRQRLALARAFLAGAPVLVLDEPTSALDIETEAGVLAAVTRMNQEQRTTVIIIAHRLSTVRRADHMIVLREGRLVQSGSPASLSTDEGWYRDMLKLSTQEVPAA